MTKKMNLIKLTFYLIFTLELVIIHCNGEKFKNNKQSIVKRDCVPLGGICEKSNDCCGVDDPNTGHCIGCWQHGGYFIKWGNYRCGCDRTSSVAIDSKTSEIISDICNGYNNDRTRCVTRVASPKDNKSRGQKLF
ncbi:hypothetical protein I4U23_022872 [Adineta vaga]|nr:hypothetical protein I4U23_022872 [Adineta vaga]